MPNVFLGVCAEDELPSKILQPCAIIVNTDPSTKDGTHWTAIYIKQNMCGEFFDSTGMNPDKPVRKFMDKQAPSGWEFNKRKVQGPFSTLCGAYCLQYLEQRANSSKPFSTLLYKLFPLKNNDELVRERMRDHYDIEIPTHDYSFLLSKISQQL